MRAKTGANFQQIAMIGAISSDNLDLTFQKWCRYLKKGYKIGLKR